MPSSDSGETRRPTKPQNRIGAAAPPPEQENLPCPRCDSTNTKFCYYNNYNYSQPRHFCKSCRRYWTHGGTLRDIPVGGGSRKNAKRTRTHHSASSTATSAVSTISDNPFPAMVPVAGCPVPFGDGDGKQNVNGCGSFTSLLSNTAAATQGGPAGFLALGGFGLGLGHGFEEMGFGIGRAGWGYPGMMDGSNIGGGGGGVAAPGGIGNSWQMDGGEGGGFVGDCFSWPGLAISTPGNCLK